MLNFHGLLKLRPLESNQRQTEAIGNKKNINAVFCLPSGRSEAVKRKILFTVAVLNIFFIASCGGGGGGGGGDNNGGGGEIIPQGTEFVVFVWNDLGMHCLNPTYDTAVILPPYNTLWAQVIRRGDPPQIVTSGITVAY